MTDLGLFDGLEPISTYTAGQAVEDGFLVELGASNLATRAVYEWLTGLELEKPPDRVVVLLMTWCAGDKALAILAPLAQENADEAARIYNENIGGGIYTTEILDRTLWLIPNEVGGTTVMFPEDY